VEAQEEPGGRALAEAGLAAVEAAVAAVAEEAMEALRGSLLASPPPPASPLACPLRP